MFPPKKNGRKIQRKINKIMKEYSLFIFLILVKLLAKNKSWRSSRWVPHSGPWGAGAGALTIPRSTRIPWRIPLETLRKWAKTREIIKVVTWVHSE